MQNSGRQTKSIMVFLKVAYSGHRVADPQVRIVLSRVTLKITDAEPTFKIALALVRRISPYLLYKYGYIDEAEREDW